MHKLHHLLQVLFAAAKVRFANWRFALPASPPAHLPQQRWTYELSTHSSAVKNDSARWS
jgi:hypothetical protein